MSRKKRKYVREFILLIALATASVLACEKIHTEVESHSVAEKAFREYILEKKIEREQFREPRFSYNFQVGSWEAYYQRVGPPDSSKGVLILVDKFGRVELFAEQS